MAIQKRSFVIYADYREQFAMLPPEDCKALLLALLDYAETGELPTIEDKTVLMAFTFIRQQIDRDLVKYEATCERNRTNGSKGGRPTKQREVEENPPEPKKPTGFYGNPPEPKKPEKDTDTDTDIDTGNETITPNSPQGGERADIIEARFAEFWKAYPKKIGKQSALKAWKRIRPTAELHAKIIDAVAVAKGTDQWARENGRFIPHPTTWLNQGRWDDEPMEGD